MSLHFLALRRRSLALYLAFWHIALYVVVVTFTDRVWDIEAVCLVLKSFHTLKMPILYLNRVNDGSSRCIEQRYSGRPAVTTPSCFIRAGIRLLRVLLRIRKILGWIYHPEDQRSVRMAFRFQGLLFNDYCARRQIKFLVILSG